MAIRGYVLSPSSFLLGFVATFVILFNTLPVLYAEESGMPEIRNLLYYRDRVNNTGGGEQFPEILKMLDSFAPLEEITRKHETPEEMYWIKTTIQNPLDREASCFIDINKGYSWRIKAYVTDKNFNLVSSGEYSLNDSAFSLNKVSSIVSFPVFVPAESERIVFFRIKTYDIERVRVRLFPTETFLRLTFYRILGAGLMYGILVGLLLYNVIIFFSSRQQYYFYFLLYACFAVIYILLSNGIGSGLFSAILFFLGGNVISFFAFLGIFSVIQYTRFFLNTGRRLPAMDLLLRIYGYIVPGVIVLMVLEGVGILDKNYAEISSAALLFSSMASLLITGILLMLKGNRQALYFVAGFGLFIAGSVMAELYLVGVIMPGNAWFFANAEQYGITFSLLAFSFALGDRFRKLKKTQETLRFNLYKMALKQKEFKEINDAKTRFLEAVSHELRTPIMNLQLPLERILLGEEGQKIGFEAPVFSRMSFQVGRITRYVDNILKMSKIETAGFEMRVKAVNLIEFVRDCAAQFEAAAGQKKVLLEYTGGSASEILAEADRELFESVVFNLLDNALKFTGSGGRIRVSVAAADSRAVLSIEDTGIGIPAGEFDRIFERYYQINAGTDDGYEGCGIGLSIVKHIVELHGGGITVTSCPGKGSRFDVSVPVIGGEVRIPEMPGPADTLQGKPMIPAGAEEKTSTPGGKTVLVVEDNADLRDHMRRLLEKEYIVIEASDGMAGLAVLEKITPHLILSDIMMPGMDGYAFLSRARAVRSLKAVPFIFLTAKASDAEMLKGFDTGAVDFIRKPFNGKILLSRIQSMLELQDSYRKDIKNRLIRHIETWEADETGTEQTGSTFSAFKSDEPAFLRNDISGLHLSERQKEILDLVLKGYTNREIARLLSLAVRTVDHHVSRLLQHFGVERRTQLSYELLGESSE